MSQNQTFIGLAAAAATYYFIRKDDGTEPMDQPMNVGIAAAVGFAVSQSNLVQQQSGGGADGNQAMLCGALAAAAAYMMLKKGDAPIQDQPQAALMAVAFGALVNAEMSGNSLLQSASN